MTPAHRLLLLLVLAAAVAAAPSPASAADPWRPEPTSCVVPGGAAGLCSGALQADGLGRVAVAPDGRHAYALAADSDAILLFDRAPETGALTPRTGPGACFVRSLVAGCTEARGLDQPTDVVISADGRHVYVSSASGSLAVFDRQADGALVQKGQAEGCVNNTGADTCLNARAFTSAHDLLMGPGEQQLYVFAEGIGMLMFDRNPVTGQLTQRGGQPGCLIDIPAGPPPEGCGRLGALGPGRQAAITPDGRNVYVPGGTSLLVLDRDPATGALTQKAGAAGCLASNVAGCTADQRLFGATTVTAAPDGGHVYVTTNIAALTYARGGAGGLTAQSCVNQDGSQGCADGRHLAAAAGAALSPDGQHLVAVHDVTFGNGFVVLEREADGDLAPVQGPDGCLSSNGDGFESGGSLSGTCRVHPLASDRGTVTFADDGQFYVAFRNSDAIIAFDRDFYPRCADAAATVPHATLAPVPLSCTDRNGDPLTIVVEQPPTAGSLGAVDQAASQVLYSPFSGFAGTDAFTYRADASGLSSAPARVTLDVAAAAPPPPPPPAPPARITSPVRAFWAVQGPKVFAVELGARNVPEGGQVQVRCSGRGCPFKVKTKRRRGSASVTVFRAVAPRNAVRISGRAFKAPSVVEVRVTAPGRIGRVLRYPVKRGKAPRPQTALCLPVGGSKPQKRC